MDGDGDQDLIICNGAGNVAWRENIGNAVFTAPQFISKNLTNSDRSIGCDIDGDGNLDVLVSCMYSNKVVWFRNNGDSTFGPEQLISNTQGGVVDILSFDVDGDGDLDVASAAKNNNKITVFSNNGNGQFSSGFNMPPSVYSPNSISASDVDNDGDADIVAAIDGNNVVWYPNLGNGTYDTVVVVSDSLMGVFTVSTGDMDGDGFFDIVSASYSKNTVVWYKNLGGGIFSGEQLIANGQNQVKQVITIDFDNDGDLDVISSSLIDSIVVWFENDGNGVFANEQIIFQGFADVVSLCVNDFNNDDQLDICVTGQNSNGRNSIISINQGGGLFSSPEELYNTIDGVTSVFTTDLNEDGLKDILATSNRDDKVGWYKNLGNGKWGKQRIINEVVDNPESICAADLDGDGDFDIVSGSKDGNIYWYENFGEDSIGNPNLLTSNAPWLGNVHTADLDGDQDEDILFATSDNDYIAWFENLGGGIFSTEQIIVSFNAPGHVWTADLDGDLDLDVICSVGGSINAVNWVENLGEGNFGPLQNIQATVDFLKVTKAGDFDGDGDTDIVTISALDDKLAWYENLGGGNFGPQIVLSLQADYSRSMDIKDIDGDGDLDIAVASDYNHNAFWIENLGGGNFSSEQLIGENMYGCRFIVIDDVDGDGDQDAVIGVWGSSVNDKEDAVLVFVNQDLSPLQARGKVFFDANQNGLMDPQEQGLGFNPIVVNPNSTFAYTYSNGNYFVNFPTGIDTFFVLQPDISANWMITSDSVSYTLEVDPNFIFTDSLDFGMHPTTLIDSIHTELVSGFPRCNDTISFTISLNNYGTTLPSGIIHLILADSLTFVNSTFIPDSIIGQNIYWHYDSIFFFSNNLFGIEISTGSFLSIGSPQESHVISTVIDGLSNITYTDSTSLVANIVCSYDPNDKISDPVGVDSLGFIDPSTNYIDYTIRFQNTGNDTAMVVRIEDQLDQNLNWYSINVLAYSHDVHMDYYPEGRIKFTFDDIYLPDSSTNFLGSQGFVKYRIHLDSNLVVGTNLYNSAKIFFDANPEVLTNTKILTLYDCDPSLNNIHDTVVLCEGEVLSITDIVSTTQFTWVINGITSGLGHELNWAADTSGVFQLSINKSNDFCSFDNTITLNIKPRSFVEVQNQIAICPSDSITIFGQIQSISGIYTNTLINIWGCDSIISQELLVHPIIPIQDLGKVHICYGDSAQVFGNFTNISGVYYDTLSSIFGCDSIISQELLVHPIIPIQDLGEVHICYGDSVQVFGNFTNIPGVYYDTLSSIFGCDSIIKQSISTQNHLATTNLPLVTICDGDSMEIFGTYRTSSGVYTDSLQTPSGCDSIIYQELIVIPSIPITNLGITSICSHDSLLIFNNYTSTAGMYYDTLQSSNGCDSIQMITIQIYPEVNVTFGDISNDTICINAQLIELSGGTPTGGSYSGNGVYSAEFDPNIAGLGTHLLSYTYTDSNNCKNTALTEIVVVGCAEVEQINWNIITVYPNPTNEELFINLGNDIPKINSIEVINVLGVKVVGVYEFNSKLIISLPVKDLSEGTYFINIKDINEVIRFRTMITIKH